MRTIELSTKFKRDFKREKKGRFSSILDDEYLTVIDELAKDNELEERHFDHKLIGDLDGYRECHIKPDLLLIYRKTDENLLILKRLGSHALIYG
jgi:mRNA interferase YafQ